MKRAVKPTGMASGLMLILTLLIWAAGVGAQGLHFNTFSNFNGNAPIGIDYHEPNGGNLILSANYPSGEPWNLNLINVATGTVQQFSALHGLTDELKIASTRSSAGCQQYPVGTVFTGNGHPGEIVRMDPAGNILPPALNNPGTAANSSWVSLPGEPYLLRGSFYIDRGCAFGGDLIVVTGNGDDPHGGGVWRISADGSAVKVATIPGKALEGMITLPNNAIYGPWAGSIVAGAETFNLQLDRNGYIYTIKPDGTVTQWDLSFTGPDGVRYPVKAEDIDIIKPGADFFGIAYQDDHVLRVPAADFAPYANQILITQEFPCGSPSSDIQTACSGANHPTPGLYVVSFQGNTPVVTPLQFAPDSGIQVIRQWEHVTFAPRGDVSITKTTDTPDLTVGATATYRITVTANGPDDSFNVILTDPLPPNLTWTIGGPDQGACSITAGTLSCLWPTMAAGTSRTITLSATTTSASCPAINNRAIVTSGNDANSENNTAGPVTINLTCPPQLKVEKLPKNGTFTSGTQVSFTIKVTNPGTGIAANVGLFDTLPDNGGLVWSSASTTQGSCVNPIAANALSCNLGSIAAGSSVTVTVLSTAQTPASACQLQPNPAAVAFADGGLVAQDFGSIDCLKPGVSIVKYTNGYDANDPNATGVPNVASGATVTWTYKVTNTGNTSIPRANVVVTDNTTGVTPTYTSEITGNGDTTFNPGEVWLYTATGTALNLTLAPPAGVHTVANSCTANGTQPPRTAYTNIGTVTIPGTSASDPSSYCNPPAPAVTIVKYTNGSDANDPNATGVPNVASGATVTWTYKVTNTGNTSIPRANVVVTDNTTGVTPTYTSEITGNGDTTFNPGEVWLYTATGTALNLTLAPPAGVHTVANSCTANGTQPPRTAYTNIGTVTIPGASATDPSSYCNPPPQLKVVKTPDGDTFAQGSQLTFTIVVSNPAPAGSATATNVKLADVLPVNGGLTWTTATTTQGTCVNPIVGNALDCSLGNIAPQGSVTVTVKTAATTPTGACQLQSNPAAIAAADGGLTARDSGSLNCTPLGSFTLTKSPKNGTYNIGDNISFTMVVTSTGPGTANNVVLNDPLPTLGNLNTWTISTNPGAVCTIVSNVLNCPFGNLANGQTRTVVVATNAAAGANATACTGAKLNNTATLTGTGLSNRIDTGDYTCQPPSITIVKTPDNASLNPGDTMKFTIVVTSGGPGVAHNVVVNDPLPTKGGVLSWTFDTGGNPGNACTIVNDVVNCPFGDLAGGQVRTIVVKTTTGMPAGVCDGSKITNTAAVTTNDAGTKTDTGDYTCVCAPSEFVFSGNTATSGTAGNIRTFTANGISVKASGFSRNTTTGAWSNAYLGLYSLGLGVTDNTEGDGSNNRHVVDNIGGTVNYVLFEFSSSVIVDRAFLDYLGADSDITVWVGTKTDPFNNHLTLSDALLAGLAVKENNDTTVGSGSRWADLNAGNVVGNVLIIGAREGGTNDSFKINKLDTKCSAGSCVATSYQFTGNTASSGTLGNIRQFAFDNGVSVKASAFSRVNGTNGAWAAAYLGVYGPGLGVTDNTEGDGASPKHKVDNIGGTNNYVLFEFTQPVIVTRTFLDSIGADSDMSVWVGTKTDPFNNHQTLSDSLLSSLGLYEENLTSTTVTSRWADVNAGKVSGNVLVISALATDTTPEDAFKISKLNLKCP